jgi:pSer/pThr/pTyr-binding forkhead associated (FHA) protein
MRHDAHSSASPGDLAANERALVRVVYANGKSEDRYLGLGVYSVGRERGDFTFPGDRNVSRIHASLEIVPGSVRITVLVSTCGTFTQHGIRLREPFPMRVHDCITIGNNSFTVLGVVRRTGGTSLPFNGVVVSGSAVTQPELTAVDPDELADLLDD